MLLETFTVIGVIVAVIGVLVMFIRRVQGTSGVR